MSGKVVRVSDELRLVALEQAVEWLFLEMIWLVEGEAATPEERGARLRRVLKTLQGLQMAPRSISTAPTSGSTSGKGGPIDDAAEV